MDENSYKEVYFGEYCKTCKYEERDEELIPCCYCLEEPVRVGTNKPVRYEEKEK